MDEATPDHVRGPTPSLTAALRRARVEEAERSDVLAELRSAEIARLEMLFDALRPVLDQIPDPIDMFDAGIVPGERPRLFIDMIGFVEIARDRRTYRFLQDTRHGRVTMAESDRLEAMTEAIASYIARRILEREKALAADRTIEDAVRHWQSEFETSLLPARRLPTALLEKSPASSGGPLSLARQILQVLLAVTQFLGVLCLLALLAAGGYFAIHVLRPWVMHHH